MWRAYQLPCPFGDAKQWYQYIPNESRWHSWGTPELMLHIFTKIKTLNMNLHYNYTYLPRNSIHEYLCFIHARLPLDLSQPCCTIKVITLINSWRLWRLGHGTFIYLYCYLNCGRIISALFVKWSCNELFDAGETVCTCVGKYVNLCPAHLAMALISLNLWLMNKACQLSLCWSLVAESGVRSGLSIDKHNGFYPSNSQ